MPYRTFASFINSLLSCMRCCFGRCTKPANLHSIQERSGGIHNPADKPSISDSFWTSSNHDIDINSSALSQRSHSLLSTSNQSLPYELEKKPTNAHSEVVNHGLALWNQNRVKWIGEKKQLTQSQKSREPCIGVCATYDGLLGTKRPFRKPIPLAEMVEFLVDLWDDEGLYD